MSGGEFRQLPVELIDVPADRARLLNPLKAEAIGATMKAERQFDPITVSPTADGRFVLVDGQHRLHGARHVGLPAILAQIIELTPGAQRKQEILSNLATAELDALGKSRNIAALYDLFKDGRTARRVGRPSKQDIVTEQGKISADVRTIFGDNEAATAEILGWDAEAAAKTGLKRRTLFEYLRVGRRVLPEAVTELANTPLADNLRELLKLSDMGDAEQIEVARAYRAGGFEKLGDAVQSVRGTPKAAKPSADDLEFQRVSTAYKRLPRKLKLRFLRDVIGADRDVPEALRSAIGGEA